MRPTLWPHEKSKSRMLLTRDMCTYVIGILREQKISSLHPNARKPGLDLVASRRVCTVHVEITASIMLESVAGRSWARGLFLFCFYLLSRFCSPDRAAVLIFRSKDARDLVGVLLLRASVAFIVYRKKKPVSGEATAQPITSLNG